MLLNVLDFPDYSATGGLDRLQAALAQASSGDRIYLPGIAPYRAPATGWEIRKSVELFGDGPGNPDGPAAERTGTVLLPHSAATSDHVLRLVNEPGTELNRVYIHDLGIASSSAAREGGDGILREISGNLKVSGLRLERLSIARLGGSGIRLLGDNGGPGAVNDLLIQNCTIENCGGDGIQLFYGFAVNITGVRSSSNAGRALWAGAPGEISLYGCVFEAGGAGVEELVLLERAVARIDACRFAGFDTTGDRVGLRLWNTGLYAVITGNTFELASWNAASPAAIGIDIAFKPNPAQTGTVCVMPNRFLNVGTAIRANRSLFDSVNGLFIAPQLGSPLIVNSQPASVIALPTVAGNAAVGVPNVSDGAASRAAGLLVPPLAANPTSQLQPAHMFYNAADDALRVWSESEEGWRDVILI